MKQKILVTGGAGYIGSVLVGSLLSHGYSVRVLDRFMFGGESLLSYRNHKHFEIVRGDIRDPRMVKTVTKGADAVIHLAALVGEPACKVNPKVTLEINFLAVKQLCKFSKQNGVRRLIFSSTCSNYGSSGSSAEATEETILRPLSVYAETKIDSEKFLYALSDAKLSITIFRLGTVFGVSPKMRFNLLLNECARDVALGREMRFRSLDAWRPYTYITDVCDAFLRVLTAQSCVVSGQIFNVVGENIQKKDIVTLVKKADPKAKVTTEISTKDEWEYRVSARKIQKILGWHSTRSVRDGFMEMVDAVRNGMFLDPFEWRFNAWYDKDIFIFKT